MPDRDAEVINLADYIKRTDYSEPARDTAEHTAAGSKHELPQEDTTTFEGASKPTADSGYMSMEKLYPLGTEKSPELKAAVRLLQEAEAFVDEALQACRDEDFLAAAIAMQELKALLPELFCCRVIGDGFGATIVALFHSIKNHGDHAFEDGQFVTIRFLVRKLASEPFLSFEEAQKLIDELEDVGFAVESPEIGILADIVNDDVVGSGT